MTHLDRLSNLISHFKIHAELLPSACCSNLILTGDDIGLNKLFLFLRDCPDASNQPDAIVHAKVDIGGDDPDKLPGLWQAHLHHFFIDFAIE